MVTRPERPLTKVLAIEPVPWRKLPSAGVEKDALYIVCMNRRELRLREIARLRTFHGGEYADDVAARVEQLWPERDEIISEAHNFYQLLPEQRKYWVG